jgi:hypothetical protein
MKTSTMTAVKLRLILIAALGLVMIAGGALFSFGYSLLSDKAKETSEVATQASSSNTKIQQLNATKKLLDSNTKAVERASKIVANSESYVYQDQIIDDLNRIANKSGIQILDITFTDATVTGGANSATAAPAAGASSSSAATTPTAGGAAGAPAALSPGVKAVSASVKISEKVQYDKMLDFLYAVEQNLTKMSISKVSLRKADGLVDGKPAVSTDQLTIEVYMR